MNEAPAPGAAPITRRSLDHFVILVRDVDQAGEAYRRLGFRVMPAMEHIEIGTSNTIVQFQNTYLELIGGIAHSRVPEMADWMLPWASHDDDIYWQTACTSARLEDELATLSSDGLAPQKILGARRRVRLASGGWDETASRSVYVFDECRIHGSIFLSDHPKPEAIWIPEWQVHPNTTMRVLGISYLARNPVESVDYTAKMMGGAPLEQRPDRIRFETPRGEFLEILGADALPEAQPLQNGVDVRGAAFHIAVSSIERCRWALRDGGVPHREISGVLIVPASHGCGMAIHFQEAEAR